MRGDGPRRPVSRGAGDRTMAVRALVMPGRRDRALQRWISWHRRRGYRIERRIVALVSGHRRRQLTNFPVDPRIVAAHDLRQLRARVGTEPAIDSNRLIRAENVDHQIVRGLNEPQIRLIQTEPESELSHRNRTACG